ncbi:arrestin domain-containing protein 1-like [Amphiura filiformis]|uniref:arrestin domain-containing protein 1-like n=1 Tax=Amphiura filiformis TaxID=82378 RepID=UPI003B21F578
MDSNGIAYFKNMQLLAKHKTVLHQTQDTPLEPGEHNLPFDFNILISTLPPSFEGPYGKIKHRIKAVARSTIKESAKDEWEFHSSPILDLNTQEHLENPIAVDKVIYGVLGRLSKPVKTFRVTLDKSGYVPGESIIVTVETNKGSKHPIEANLRQVAKFVGSSMRTIKSAKRTIANILSTVEHCCLLVSCEATSEQAEMISITMPELIVPPTPPSGLVGCKIITLEYDVVVSNKVMDVKIPIVIGNVPLHMALPCQHAPPSFEELPNQVEMSEAKESLPAEEATGHRE